MKNLIMTILMTVTVVLTKAQTNDEHAIQKVITEFAKAGDTYDLAKLKDVLDENYTIIMNRLFGSTTVQVIDKTTYLANIESKKFGGDTRTVTFDSITINGKTASAKVKLSGLKLEVVSIILLVQNEKGEWHLISDMPVVL